MLPVSHESPSDCAICEGTFVNPQKTPCNHTFCKDCITSWIENTVRKKLETTCPTCRGAISIVTLSNNADAQSAVGALAQKAQEAAKSVIIADKKADEPTEFSSVEGAVSCMAAYYFTACAEHKRDWQFEGVVKGRRFIFKSHYDPNLQKFDPELVSEVTNLSKFLGNVPISISVGSRSASCANTEIVLYANGLDQEASRMSMSLIMALSKAGISAKGSVLRRL